jgi:hypothetical protein
MNGLYEAQIGFILKIQDQDPNNPDQMAAVLSPSRQIGRNNNEAQLKRDTSLQASAEFVSANGSSTSIMTTLPMITIFAGLVSRLNLSFCC